MKKFVGNSGSNLKLVRIDHINYVKKISPSKKYNQRLKNQMIKQSNFESKIIKVPLVKDFGFNEEGLFYFIMEYINGIKFSDYISYNSFEDSKKIFKKILDYIFSNIDAKKDYSSEIRDKISSLSLLVNFPPKIKRIVSKFKFNNLCSGYCHGDLTFENIMIYKNEIYFIDFLDSFIDSPLIDISKIKQEIILNWSNRNDDNNFLSLLKKYHLNKILEKKISNNLKNSTIDIEFLTMITILRILPYVSNNKNLNDKIIKKLNKWKN